ncbi:methionine ABC transporter ATP-binding protein [Actinoplanes sp. SE50]|uniref:methionine ABC transporter permease n=1 Tax=unclassified Actinoplanes TaxID=2626549 RepID=UPI00023ED62B|nr:MULTISPECIES: ABC transporter permease subunit [unclassified Actinoplanes]AEV85641.1 putative D-methionine transport system permease protein metI [Actinoplanes sp. SE50/110]ATO84034.1 methionine ABC transporter ATP-binding protein [Actinoplanes sp. SE50]SLM01444.1 methionine ABC transporter ATP-binding protein [Actinoplanes sp. SE50/110]
MDEFLTNLPVFREAIGQTFYIVSISVVAGGLLGLALGLILYATRPGSLLANRAVFLIVNILVNIVRPIPFVIFLTAIQPLMLATIGTTIGTDAVTFALSLAAAFAVSRIIEQNLLAVEPGVIEAARAAGARPISILLTVVVPEALGPVILGYTFIFVGVVDMSAQAGLFGGGGLGDFAVTYGSQRYNWPVVYITVATIIVIVQAGQFLGNFLARRALRR